MGARRGILRHWLRRVRRSVDVLGAPGPVVIISERPEAGAVERILMSEGLEWQVFNTHSIPVLLAEQALAE